MNFEQAKFIKLPQTAKRSKKPRKSGLNINKEGSVRRINGKVYVDFMYLDERVRESSDLVWTEKSAKQVREQLDKIVVSIKSGTLIFAEVFPKSKKVDYFTEKEIQLLGGKKTPDQVIFNDYVWTWYNLHKDSGRVSERTLLGYKSNLNLYLIPFFGEIPFAALNKSSFDKFISWSKTRKYRGNKIINKTANKIFIPLKMICANAAIEYGWGNTYNPFFGFKKLPEDDPYEKINPFSLDEQKRLISHLPDHWKPYFTFAFCSGLRQGEQIGLKPGDINWDEKTLRISRAITRNENGKFVMGRTKNKHSRRTIKLLPSMLNTLEAQKNIYDRFKGEYFFCSKTGKRINSSHLRLRDWIPTLEKVGLDYREMKQTRHSFATNALSCGENPLWIAKVMGHRDTEMINKVYAKYIENAKGTKDGTSLDAVYQGFLGNGE